MLKAQDTQFKLLDDGQIFYQPQASNPLPGVAIARLVKGETALSPRVEMLCTPVLATIDTPALQAHLEGWLARHITTVLEPLTVLADCEKFKSPVQGIAAKIRETMGIVPRGEIENFIAALDADDRRDLRSLKINLGPILVFVPALNKPAAVRLRAVLWGLFHDKILPVATPKDGVVSFVVEADAADPAFYTAVGYPVFGGRAIRVDMLGRVMSAVYDSAKDGQFQARHEWAEWLGCPIDGLYAVLESMGHYKIEEPKVEEPTAVPEVAVEAVETVETVEAAETAETDTPPVVVKPALAMFRLKKNKPHFEKRPEKKKEEPKKEWTKKDKKPEGERPKFRKDKPRDAEKDRAPKVVSTGPKPKFEDSPFAILAQLRKGAE